MQHYSMYVPRDTQLGPLINRKSVKQLAVWLIDQ